MSFCWDLSGRASGTLSTEDRKNNAVQLIRRLQHGLVIFTDGSCIGGTAFGGSAAIVWRGDPVEGEVAECLRMRGRRWTCSFDTEIAALGLAASNVASLDPGPDVLICSDCSSAIDALSRASADKRLAVRDVITVLHRSQRRSTIAWIPAHCGIPGNEKADFEANAAAERDIPRLMPEIEEAVTLNTASSLLKARSQKTIISHERLQKVYDRGRRSSNFTANINNPYWSRIRIDWPPGLRRKDHVLLAQLRSGHCTILAGYASVIRSDGNPHCPHCPSEPETLEHWLCHCPAYAAQRLDVFCDPAPALSVLSEYPLLGLLYARKLGKQA